MIRLSVTDLDGYLYWRGADEMSFGDLLARLRGTSVVTDAMMAGRAFHTLLETTVAGDLKSREIEGFQFEFKIDAEIALPPIRELKAEVVFDTAAGPVMLVGKVDAMYGRTVHDYKLTTRFDVERYIESYQWRSYLSMFGAHTFNYDVFVCRYDGPRITIHEYHRLPFCAYPGMRDDVARELGRLASIVAEHVPEKITREVAA